MYVPLMCAYLLFQQHEKKFISIVVMSGVSVKHVHYVLICAQHKLQTMRNKRYEARADQRVYNLLQEEEDKQIAERIGWLLDVDEMIDRRHAYVVVVVRAPGQKKCRISKMTFCFFIHLNLILPPSFGAPSSGGVSSQSLRTGDSVQKYSQARRFLVLRCSARPMSQSIVKTCKGMIK